jgi:3-mercaptopyruvate sulfurtransferase SseA
MRFLTTVPVLAMLAFGCSRAASPPQGGAHATTQPTAEREIPGMTVDELAGMIDRREAVAVYDANGRERYERGHIPGARYVGHDEVTAAMLPQDRATRLVFYCYNEH